MPTSGAAESPASRFPSRVLDEASRTRGIFGLPSRNCFAWFDPDTSSLRTFQVSLLTQQHDEFSATLPPAGTMRNGRLSELTTLELPISESGSGSGPIWQSPDTGGGGRTTKGSWPTPRAAADKMGRPRENDRDDLQAAAHRATWPTPDANAWKGSSKPGQRRGQISEAVECGPTAGRSTRRMSWATPQARDWKGESGPSIKGTEMDLPMQVKKQSPGQLNPSWVEWLMGYPIGFTALDASATRSSRKSSSGSGGE